MQLGRTECAPFHGSAFARDSDLCLLFALLHNSLLCYNFVIPLFLRFGLSLGLTNLMVLWTDLSYVHTYTLNNYLNRFEIWGSLLCHCGVYDSADYILFHCPIHSLQRWTLIIKFYKDGLRTFNKRYLLSVTSSSDTIKHIHEFPLSNNTRF